MGLDEFFKVYEKFNTLWKETGLELPKTTSVYVDEESMAIEIHLDPDASYYGEWIKGEGGDICLHRDQETDRVVGVRLPLTHINVTFVTNYIKKEKKEL